MTNGAERELHLGTYAGPLIETGPTVFTCLNPVLSRHAVRPWCLAHLKNQHGLEIAASPAAAGGEAIILLDKFVHLLATGPSGSGKTRALLVVLAWLLRFGYSVIALDVKLDSLIHLLSLAFQAGIPVENAVLLSPTDTAYVPGHNPFASNLPHQVIASAFLATFEAATPAGGARMTDTLANALAVVIAHGLSVRELIAFLVDDSYRARLIALPLPESPDGGPDYAAIEGVRFWKYEASRWTRSETVQAISVIVRRLREWVRNPFLRPMLQAERDTLRVERLFERQGLLLAHLDPSLGYGATLLAGQIVTLAYRTALAARGTNKVVLLLDEASFSARMVGDVLGDILAVARSFNLHLMVACQHTGQLPERLVESLMVNASVKLYFRSADRAVAASLAARTVPVVERITLEPEPEKGDRPAPTVKVRHRIRDGYGTPLRLSDRSWEDFNKFAAQTGTPVETLATLASGTYLFVHAADTGKPVPLASYVRGIPPEDLCIEGPALRLTVRFPRPKVRSAERPSDAEILKAHLKALAELPNRHCVADIQGRSAGIVRVADMPDPVLDAAFDDYLDAVRRSGGQSPEEIAAVERRRTESIDSAGAAATYLGEESTDDGSI